MSKQSYFGQFSLAKVHSLILFDPLIGATTLDLSETWSDDNERVLRIPQSSSITGASLSDC